MFQDPGHAFLKNLQRKLLLKFLPAGLAHVAAQVFHRQILDQNKRNIFSPHIATSQTLCDYISTIAVRILQSLLHLSEVELMNAHMINQILPLLLAESTRQGIAKHNAMEAVLTRHPSLNHRKLMKSQAQEQVEDIIVDQTVLILPISKDNVKDRRNDYLVRHSSNEPVRQANRPLLSTSEIDSLQRIPPL